MTKHSIHNPFNARDYSDDSDSALIQSILQGQRSALKELIEKHQAYIFNVALKMMNNVHDAEDVTQEVLIKVLSNLVKYDPAKARFRTWLYRITFNHILNLKKQPYEQAVSNFDFFFDFIDSTPVLRIEDDEEADYQAFIEESKIACMSGMIMCLDRDQRLVYVLGELFEMDHRIASEMFNITPANWRKKLSRARKDLYQWMHNRCGLVNTDNPCRCPKKTKGFIQRGVVKADSLKWNADYKSRIYEHSKNTADVILNERDRLYRELFQEHPFKTHRKPDDLLSIILSNRIISDNLDLRHE
ncbi:MAG: RNA polymerase sigma factor [Bacteroidota bacterium]